MNFLHIFIGFGGLATNIRRGKARALKSPMRGPASMPTQRAAAAKIVQAQPAKVEVRDSRKSASASARKTEPVEMPKTSRSGGRVGGKTSTQRPTNVGHGDTTIMMGPTWFKGPQKNTIISYSEYDENSPPPPIEVTYETGQTGSSKRLDQYKKMYKGSTYELNTATLTVGGVESQSNKKYRPSTMAGFGRKNVHWPYWLNDYYATSADQLTSRTSCFNRFQIENLFYQIWKASGVSGSQISQFIEELENTVGGDIRVDFPLDYIECEYKYFNNNIAMPIDLSLYICTPVKDLPAARNPMADWFNPGTADPSKDFELMYPDYYYEPSLTASQGVMFDNNSGTISNISILGNYENILTASTEVVPEATPQGFSVKFRRNWNVKHVQHFVLQPQQELIVKFRVKMSQLLDLKQTLAFEQNGSNKYQSFKDMTMFPLVTFQGQDTTAVSSKLKRKANNPDMNRFIATSAPRSSASMLSTSMTTRARVHAKSAPLRNFSGYTYTLGDLLDLVSVSKRELLAYDSVERGEQCSYWEVNDNLGYFCDKDTQPGSGNNYYLSQLTRLSIKGTQATLPFSAEPTASQLVSIDTDSNWGVVQSKTISRASVEKTGSDISG